MSQITYEWITEHMDEHGDIFDVAHSDKFPGFAEGNEQVGLVRDDGYCREPRAWAYIKDGKLPEYFTDAYDAKIAKVPARFHAAIAKNKLAA